jgi:hypothetical protein
MKDSDKSSVLVLMHGGFGLRKLRLLFKYSDTERGRCRLPQNYLSGLCAYPVGSGLDEQRA